MSDSHVEAELIRLPGAVWLRQLADPDAPIAPLAALEAAIERDDTDAMWAALAALGVGERRPPDQPVPRRRTHEPPGLLWTDPRTHRVVRAAEVADPEDAPWPPLEGARPQPLRSHPTTVTPEASMKEPSDVYLDELRRELRHRLRGQRGRPRDEVLRLATEAEQVAAAATVYHLVEQLQFTEDEAVEVVTAFRELPLTRDLPANREWLHHRWTDVALRRDRRRRGAGERP